MIDKIKKHAFAMEQTASPNFTSDWVKEDLMRDVVNEIMPGKDYLFRLDTYTQHYPISNEIVYEVRCRAEELEGSIESPRIILPKRLYLPWPKDVIFNPPATIVFWGSGEKTVVKCMDGDEFNPEVGLAMCFCKKVMGDGYKRWFEDALKKGGWEE